MEGVGGEYPVSQGQVPGISTLACIEMRGTRPHDIQSGQSERDQPS